MKLSLNVFPLCRAQAWGESTRTPRAHRDKFTSFDSGNWGNMIVPMFVAVRIGCGRPALRMLALVIDDNGNGRKLVFMR